MVSPKALIRLLAVVALAALFATSSDAHEYKLGALTIVHPWSRPSIGQTGSSAAYMTITNAGPADDTLLSAATPVAKAAELHAHIKDGDVMRMRRVEGGVPVPGAGVTEFKPGGLHVMLLGLTRPLKEGEMFPLTLTFAKAGEVTVEIKVEPLKGPGGHH